MDRNIRIVSLDNALERIFNSKGQIAESNFWELFYSLAEENRKEKQRKK